MSIVVKYNNDMRFRRHAAFNRMYRARDFKRRRTIEILLGVAFALIAVGIWKFGGDIPMSTYMFYASAGLALVFLVRLLRAFLVSRRVSPLSSERDFHFSEGGFTFGPIDEAGNRLETRWREVDKVYIMRDAIYILCMQRRHWVAIDKQMFTSGTPDELEALIRDRLPQRLVRG